MQLLVNKGDGVFVDETDIRFPQNKIPSPPTTELFHGWHKSVEVVDLNLDGYEDMVLDYSSTSPTILINDGNGKFIEQDHESMGLTPPNTWGNYVAVGDFNNDGSPDLVVLEQGNVFTTYINQITQPTGLGVIGSYDSSAIYRFFNTETGSHFYTASEAEMESVKVELAGVMNYEGIAYYVDIA